ncbi:neutral/alkaline non-lysosomal ceramidase N-terminal domain-containing protein [Bacillus timonensis]|uniref:neutral/alkaline non-lysosomal ceramidase N-terminal domain-containing protein n=1 Tax=Bacillus timonensis TaxID=1033734 RepID=UPI0002882AF3|nr:neutral/alkaline non-lysosomal ceramidase N-terminal domain-containing protein [Bacillus timonensis]
MSADLIWWGNEYIELLQKKLYEKWNLAPEFVVLHATHNHSAPQTTKRFTESLGRCDNQYLLFLEQRLFEGIELALNNVEPVTIDKGIGECHIGINRRKKVENRVKLASNPAGPIDPQLNLIRFRTENDKTKAILTHYTCHPVTSMENLVTSEFTGVAMQRIETALGENVVAAYLQGCCGDIQPSLIKDNRFYFDSGKIDELATQLAHQVLKTLRSPMKSLSPCILSAKMVELNLPLQSIPALKFLESKQGRSGVTGEWSKLLLNNPERLVNYVPLKIQILTIANGLTLLTMNAEVVVEYGLNIKKQSSEEVLPIPYSNGMIGYIPTASQIAEGGYEAYESCFYFGLPAPFAPEIENTINMNINSLLNGGIN